MKYSLESDDEHLALYRKYQPMDKRAREYVKNADVLRLREIICAHYEVNPFMPPHAEIHNKITGTVQIHREGEDDFLQREVCIRDTRHLLYLVSLMSENCACRENPNLLFEQFGFHKGFLDFYTFVFTADFNSHRLMDLFTGSIHAGEVSYCGEATSDGLVKKQDYAEWALKKGFPLPSCFVSDDILSLKSSNRARIVENCELDKLTLPELRRLNSRTLAALFWKDEKYKNMPAVKLAEDKVFRAALSYVYDDGGEKDPRSIAEMISNLGPRSHKIHKSNKI